MTDDASTPTPGQEGEGRRVIRVPDPGRDRPGDPDEGLVNPRDLGSASRSCLAIIIVMLAILLLLCVFLTVQTFR